MGAVYWVGRDNNIYYKGDDGNVVNRGSAGDLLPGGKLVDGGVSGHAKAGSFQAQRIADPVAAPAPQAPSGGGSAGGGTATKRALNGAAVNATQQAINSLDTELATGYKNIDDSWGSLMGRYDAERGNTREDFDEGVTTNNQNFQRNKQNSLVAGAQGLRGLRSVLASIGALSGDGGKLANEAVTTSTNQDIGGATEAAANNNQTLNKAWERFDEEDQNRRREAETQKNNQRTALEGSVAGKRQNFFQKMAELYGEVDDVGNATQWLNRAGGLNNEIASKTAVAATPFTPKAAAYTPDALDEYLGGAGDMTVKVTDDSVMAGPSWANSNNIRETEDQRRKRQLVTA